MKILKSMKWIPSLGLFGAEGKLPQAAAKRGTATACRAVRGIIPAVLVSLFVCRAYGSTDPGSGGTNAENCALAAWFFSDTNWLNSAGHGPMAFTNLANVPGGDGNALQVDSTNAAFLRYHVTEVNGATNLTVDQGSLMLWFRPDWSSANHGGSGPGSSGRLIEVGSYTANASYGWWSLYLDSGGTNLYFSAQTNNGAGSTYVSAAVSWTSNVWHFLALTYCATNSAIYVDGQPVNTNGLGVSYRPGPDVLARGFGLGSDTNGLSQIKGQIDDFYTYRCQMDGSFINGTYNMFGFVYYGASFMEFLKSAPSVPTASPDGGLDMVGGPGYLLPAGPASNCVMSGRIYITNVVGTVAASNTTSLSFDIAGGAANVPYDVFGTTAMRGNSITNDQWAWLGQVYTCNRYTLTNQPAAYAFYVLGTPQDTDLDGLTDAYEVLVSKTDPTKAISNNDGIPEAWEVLNGLDPQSPGLGGQDPDQDALTNKQEYLYGTRPLVSEGSSVWVSTPNGLSGIP